ncbi:MAG: glycosyltransferase family 2 protein [Candidatus Promineifilaceae bacterium]
MTTPTGSPRISVIIPLYNGRPHLQKTLTALYQSHYANWECIVIDDGSTDGSQAVVKKFDATLLFTTEPQSGPAAARNIGAEAAYGDILFFIDADVLVYPDTLGRIAATFTSSNPPAACFGSYDDQPAEQNFLSRYKNLQHYYIHQTADMDATTFWSGCGAVRREIFLGMGGFSTAYGRPSIEDIELGGRLKAAGYAIWLDKALQVKHLKKWTLGALLRSDILDRAVPWSRLIARNGRVPNDLNLRTGHRLSAALVCLMVLCAVAGWLFPPLWLVVPICIVGLIVLNRPFYQFLVRKIPLPFTFFAILYHWFYLLYSTFTFSLIFLYIKIISQLQGNTSMS